MLIMFWMIKKMIIILVYHSFDDGMSEVIMTSSLDNSIEDLLDFVSESLGLDSIPIDHGGQVDNIAGPINESFDFLGFEPIDSQKSSLDAPNNVEVPARSTLDVRPKRALRPSRRPMDDQFDWDQS